MKNKDSISPVFNNLNTINCRGQLVDLSRPLIMGILNVTPDSFFDGGKFTEEKAIFEQVAKMIDEGATIIDIGGQSTRPGAKALSVRQEENRVLPVIASLMAKFPDLLISADTFRSIVARKAIQEGAAIINDISGGDLDPEMFHTIAEEEVPYILMHMQGVPETMQVDPSYDNVVTSVYSALLKKVSMLRSLGVADIIVDPGFGFGKTVEHNYRLLQSLQLFRNTGCPVLAGMSRKSMICKVLKVKPENALNGTTALNMIALLNGASILRVHDVKAAKEAILLYEAYIGGSTH
jgi:dihydropteroate synthase